jgi:hypothetical protein
MLVANAEPDMNYGLSVPSVDDVWLGVHRDVPLECIEACTLCEFACLACAEACLGDIDLPRLKHCVRLNLDCAEVCLATRMLVSEALLAAPRLVLAQLMVCARLCASCEAECRRFGLPSDRFSACAHACAHCEELCRETGVRVQNLH